MILQHNIVTGLLFLFLAAFVVIVRPLLGVVHKRVGLKQSFVWFVANLIIALVSLSPFLLWA